MNQIPEKENPPVAPPPATDKPVQPGHAPREISREEMDHKQPADADPDDPASP
ncbi:MAG: hypothetical protein ACJ8G3_23560 [Burkholderiaceae bacterium]